MTEAALMAAVTELARAQGWLVYHPWRSVKSETGFPDLVMVRPPRVVFAEMKTEKGRLRKGSWNKGGTRYLPGQDEWLATFGECPGVEVFLWRPADWLSGVIERILR
jgi:hypothetical protein